MSNVAITGGTGFLGKYVEEKFLLRGGYDVFALGSKDYNLTDEKQVSDLYQDIQPSIIVHLAATVGGIGANMLRPADYFHQNMLMGLNVIHQAAEYERHAGLPVKVVVIGTVCAYPKYTPTPFKEYDLWMGYPEETNAPYGIAKRALVTMAQAYRQQYNLNSIYLLPVNLYGPGDNFDPTTSHVIPALIKKAVEAKTNGEKEVPAWGTGNASREFLYVEDAAEAIILAAEKYNSPNPVNIGTGNEIKISDLASKISDIVDPDITWKFDITKPDGQPRRCLDCSRAYEEFGFQARTALDDGLRKTIDWYTSQIH